MIAVIYKDGEYVNRIVVDNEAWVSGYCADNGYTYELEPEPEPAPPAPPAYTETQLLGQQLTDLELLVLGNNSSGGGGVNPS